MNSKVSRVCLVTTVKNPGPFFGDFLRYHLAIGFERIYVFFEDPCDLAIPLARNFDQVRCLFYDKKYNLKVKKLKQFSKLKDFRRTEVMARQQLNAEMAMGFGLKEGFDWIFHIDSDELLYNKFESKIGDFMRLVPEHIGAIVIMNNEAVPGSMDIENPFTQVTLFKKNFSDKTMSQKNTKLILKYFLKTYFFAYPNGKGAARLNSDLLPITVHRFLPLEKEISKFKSAVADELTIYHYPNCGFDQYLTKYRVLGKFKDKWFRKIPMPDFHMESRDAFHQGDFRKLKKLYKNNVQISEPKIIKTLLKAKIIEKNTYMFRIVKQKKVK